MRPLPGAASNAPCGGIRGQDDTSPTFMPPHLACYITTEAELDAAGDNPPGPSPQFHSSTHQRKRSVDNRPSRSPRGRSRHRAPSSPALTSASLASLSSSAFDLDSKPGTPQFHSPAAPLRRAGMSSVSLLSSTSSQKQSTGASSHVHHDLSTGQQSQREEVSQLIMPSLQLQERRPFSIPGKSLGRLKILVAGPPGGSILQESSGTTDRPNISL
jgi:hypothetical protein